jgi:hypothetical protein
MTILVLHPQPNVFPRHQVTTFQQQQLLELQHLISVQLDTIAHRAQQVANSIHVSPDITAPKVLLLQSFVQQVTHVDIQP